MLCVYPELNSACYHVLYEKERCCYIITLNREADIRLPAAPERKLVTLTKETKMTKKSKKRINCPAGNKQPDINYIYSL